MISSLGCGVSVVLPMVVSSIIVVPPITASSRVVGLSQGKFECLEESLVCLLGELGCHLPLEVGFAGLFFPFLESPRSLCGGVESGGINDGASESLLHSVLQGFNGSFVI